MFLFTFRKAMVSVSDACYGAAGSIIHAGMFAFSKESYALWFVGGIVTLPISGPLILAGFTLGQVFQLKKIRTHLNG